MGARHRERRRVGLDVRPFYTVTELARAGKVSRFLMRRLLRSNGITFLRAGRSQYVMLTEIREKIPSLWESLRLAEELRSGASELPPLDEP
jgi:hypothetical protein